MNTLSYKTVSANAATVNKEWVLVDADGQTLGRLASKVAKLITNQTLLLTKIAETTWLLSTQKKLFKLVTNGETNLIFVTQVIQEDKDR